MTIPRDPTGGHDPSVPLESDVVSKPEPAHGHDSPHPSADPEGIQQ